MMDHASSQPPTPHSQGPYLCALAVVVAFLGVGGWELGVARSAAAQEMPDPALIHGRALPAAELPNGTVTVRVVREAIGNNVPGQQVRVTADSTVRTATTDEQGRAEFQGLPVGGEAFADVTVDGERLVSQPFSVPASGGLRVILIAGLEQAAARKKEDEAAAAAAPPVKGVVVLGGNSRVLMEFDEDSLQVFYVLEIVNNARSRVDIGGPIVIDLPREAVGAAKPTGAPPAGTVSGNRLTITGPFPTGTTPVQVAFRLPYSSPELTFAQKWPVAVQQVTVGVQKVGSLSASSPQFAGTNEIRTEDGTLFIVGSGPTLPADGTLTVALSNLPLHSRTPRYVALALALGLLVFGAWLAMTGRKQREDARRALASRRDTLLSELEQLELKTRTGGINPERYATRRQRIVRDLERIYGELDAAESGPHGGGEGVAA